MGRRRKVDDAHENHERWLVSYADFITLLFAFFVVMYAISSINEGKYRVLSDALSSAFRNIPGTVSGAMVQINPNAPLPATIPAKRAQPTLKGEEAREKNRELLRAKARELSAALAPLASRGQVRVAEGLLGVTVEISASVLFDSGEARIKPEAIGVLAEIGRVLATTDFPITVEGHTDNVPINSLLYPSNWELSGARAASVVRLFIEVGVDPRRLSAVGYAEQRPIADNATAEGRSRNRRVTINLEAKTPDQMRELEIHSEESPRQSSAAG